MRRNNDLSSICLDCQRACGGCSWSAVDPITEKIRFEPVPGWTATRVRLNLGGSTEKNRYCDTYRITACPQFLPDPPRKPDRLELTEEQSRWFLERRGACS